MTMQRVLVTGGRGKTGAPLVESLSQRPDVDVLAGTRHPDRLELDRARPVAFDWDDRSTWAAAVEGIDAVFVVRPDLEHAPALVTDLLATTPSDTHVVLLSEVENAYFDRDAWALRVETAVRDSGRTWTMVRPGWFMQVFTDPRFFLHDIVEKGQLRLVSNGQGVAWIDARDIAAVAEVALMDPGHAGQVYEITGPAALTLQRTAELLAASLGRPVEHVEVTMDEALVESEGFQRHLDHGAFDRIRLGLFGIVTSTVREVTGNAPRSFEQFLTDHADQLRDASSEREPGSDRNSERSQPTERIT
jgi:uncharacterized protein YbjT (DUF2867 family)